MCTVILLRRPDHDWPLILGANRDEKGDRPWRPPARHWPDREDVTAGLDELAGGTWLGINDYGVVACVLNRMGTLGPAPDKRSRGELPLEALDHAEAEAAAEALSHLNPAAYRPFNMIVADARAAFWIAAKEGENRIHTQAVPEGLSMLTAHDMNDDDGSARQRHYRPKFEAASPPQPSFDPDSEDWTAWQMLLESTEQAPESVGGGGPESAMLIQTDWGFRTTSSSLIALPGTEKKAANPRIPALWRFRGRGLSETPWESVDF